jgi:hypothetical protein
VRDSPCSLARSKAHLRYPASGTWRSPETSSTSSRACQHNHDPRPLLALDTQHGKTRCRRHGRGFGIVSTAYVLLTKLSMFVLGLLIFTVFAGKTKGRRADSNRLPLLQLRVCGQWLLRVARVCFSRITTRFFVPSIAHYCIRVRVKLGSSVRKLRVAGSFANQMCQALAGPPNRRGDVPTRDFHLCGDPPIPFTKSDNHAGVAHVALTSMHRSGAKGSSVDPTRRSLQYAGYRLPRDTPSRHFGE